MLVLTGVFNTRILDVTNYANQDYMRVNSTLIVVYTMLLVTGSQSKNVSFFCLDMTQYSDRRLVNHCAMPSIGQTWRLASIGAVVYMAHAQEHHSHSMKMNDWGMSYPPDINVDIFTWGGFVNWCYDGCL
jgi:hypothetical protein